MKIFHIITRFDLGGAERVAINIAKSKNKRFEYHIVEVAKGNSPYTDAMLKELKQNNIIYHRSLYYNKKIAILFFPFWFLKIFLIHKPDVIHTHTEIPDLSIYLFHFLIPWSRVKYVRTIHNTQLWNEWKDIGKFVERFFIHKKASVAISLATQRNYSSVYSVVPPIINNGVYIKQHLVFEHLMHDKMNILFAGRLEYQKGIDEMIAVIRQLESNEHYFFHVVGTGSMDEEVHTALKQCKNVALYDKIYNLSAYLSSFDYLFMPSNFEGLSLMAIEACMCKLPVIINSCPGLEEIFPSDWILKVKGNSVNAYLNLFEKIIPYINYDELSKEVYQYSVKKFSMERMQRAYEKYYLETI